MKKYDIALIVTIEAPTYEYALGVAEAIADGVGQQGENCSAVTEYEHDNEGQRVLYLHSEDRAYA